MGKRKKPLFSYGHDAVLALLGSASWQQTMVLLQLSRRQREILESYFFVDTDALVADRLRISVRTVQAHMRCMCGKVGVSSRTQLLAAVLIAYARLTRVG